MLLMTAEYEMPSRLPVGFVKASKSTDHSIPALGISQRQRALVLLLASFLLEKAVHTICKEILHNMINMIQLC